MSEFVYRLLDKGVLPDFLVRIGIRSLLRERLREIDHGTFEQNHEAKMKWIAGTRTRQTIADVPEKANEQHYEVPTDFILSTLGPRGKYSSCLFPTGGETLEEAENLMLESYCEKARLKDGIDILDLGCGWGSLSIFLAEKYPNSRVTGLSNSTTQKAHIDSVAHKRGISNITVITADVNSYDFPEDIRFDRILSIEMFEHMKNYEALFKKVASWLRPKDLEGGLADEALLFIHIFCHKTMPYDFIDDGSWMAKNFFSGGTMPSFDLPTYFQSDVALLDSWYLPGIHYSRTLEAWLRLQDTNAKEGLASLKADAIKQGKPESEGLLTFNRPVSNFPPSLRFFSYPSPPDSECSIWRARNYSTWIKANSMQAAFILFTYTD